MDSWSLVSDRLKPSRHLRGCPAFSLIEVVVAIGIVSFAFLILLALVPMGIKSEETTASETSAVNLMNGLVSDFATTPLTVTSGGSVTTNTASGRMGIGPLPGSVTTAVCTTNYLTETQQVTNATSAQFRVIINYVPANTTSGAYSPPAALIQISWPAQASSANSQGLYESYVTFPPYAL